jgi:hypothetical protein
MIVEDIKKRLFKKAKKNLAQKNKEEGKHLMLSCEEVKSTEF